jgi:sphingosine kinase
MDPDAPAGPAAKPDRESIPGSGATAVPVPAAAAAGADQVLVLSPGVTLTLGEDALLMSGMSVSMAEMGGPIFTMINYIAGQLATKRSRSCLCTGSPGESATANIEAPSTA